MSIKSTAVLITLCFAVLSLSVVQAQAQSSEQYRGPSSEQGASNADAKAQDKNSDAPSTGEAKASTAPAAPPTRRFTPTEEIRADSILSLPADM